MIFRTTDHAGSEFLKQSSFSDKARVTERLGHKERQRQKEKEVRDGIRM